MTVPEPTMAWHGLVCMCSQEADEAGPNLAILEAVENAQSVR